MSEQEKDKKESKGLRGTLDQSKPTRASRESRKPGRLGGIKEETSC